MSMWSPEPAAPGFTTARFYLASIGQQYAGHTLVVDLFDPGDGTAGASPFTMQFLAATVGDAGHRAHRGHPGVVQLQRHGQHHHRPDYARRLGRRAAIKTLNANSSTGIYNDKWLRVSINIPSSYTCTTDCWWTVQYSFGNAGRPTDRTVWVVNVLGDPVHLTK